MNIIFSVTLSFLISSAAIAKTQNNYRINCDKMSKTECDVVMATNQERMNNGLQALRVLPSCVDEAKYHAEDMASQNYFSHDGLTESWDQRMLRFQIPGSKGENIAAGQTSVPEVMTSWMNSPHHRENILNPNYRSMSTGLARGGTYGFYWVQCFSSANGQ